MVSVPACLGSVSVRIFPETWYLRASAGPPLEAMLRSPSGRKLYLLVRPEIASVQDHSPRTGSADVSVGDCTGGATFFGSAGTAARSPDCAGGSTRTDATCFGGGFCVGGAASCLGHKTTTPIRTTPATIHFP